MAKTDVTHQRRRANGAGSISSRPDGALILRVTRPDGRRAKRIVRRGLRDDRKSETHVQHLRRAERLLQEFSAEIIATEGKPERWTVERWARERYLPSVAESRKPNTIASYTKVLDTMLAPYVGQVELARLTVDDVDDLDRRLVARDLSTVSRRHARGLLGRIVRHARSKGIVRGDPTTDADKIRTVRADHTRGSLEPEQVAALLAAAKGTPWAAPLALLSLLGLRRGEVLGLAWEAIDLNVATLTVERNMVTLPRGEMTLGTPKTQAGRRTLNLDSRLVAVLRAHRKRQAEAALSAGPDWAGTFTDDQGDVVTLVFTDEAGRPLPGHRLNTALKQLAAEAGLGHVHPHLLRHSAASLMIDQGTNPAAVGAVLGHASPAVTMAVYAHALSRANVAATNAISTAVGEW